MVFQYKNVALFDFSHALHVAYKSLGKQQGPNDAENQAMTQLAEVRNACDHVIVALDSKPYKRSVVYPEYKAQREREPELVAMWSRCVERLTLDGYQTARAPGAEADDVIASLADYYVGEGCLDVRIYSIDKDLLQCVNDHVRCFAYTGHGEWEVRDAHWVRTRFGGVDWTKEKTLGPEPEHIPLVLAIMGDKSDNIPGIAGIGVKGAVKLIHTYKSPLAMAQACIAEVESSKKTGKLPAFWRDYNAGMANLPLWLRLTTLDDHAELEKHPLKYLEKLEMKPLAQSEQSDADDSDFTLPSSEPYWEEMEREAAERERAETQRHADALAAAEKQADAKRERLRPPKHNASLPDGGVAAYAAEHAPAPKAEPAATTPAPAPSAAGSAPSRGADPKAQSASAPSGAGTPAQAVATTPAIAPASSAAAAAEIVPRSQGPQEPKAPMVVVPPPSWELATQPRSPSEMAMVATRFFDSRFYQSHNNANGTFAVIALGRELGLGAAASVEGFHIVNNRPFAKATTLKALAERDPNCEWLMVTSADDQQATVETKHRKIDKVLTYTYTIDRAEKAGYLTGKNRENWITKTQEMLEARATSKAVRRWYPGSTLGMISTEEAADE